MSERTEAAGAGKGFASSALLVAAVLAIVAAGTLLKAPPPPAEPARPIAAEPSPLPLGSAIRPEPPPTVPAPRVVTNPPPPADPLTLKLAKRAKEDCARLAAARGRFTAQLLVACRAETVDRLLDIASESMKLYVLPTTVRDDACFRVCFGTYGTSQEASIAADLPKALRGKDRIGAVAVVKVLP
jgi:septal ring-binding cell division protein DamX